MPPRRLHNGRCLKSEGVYLTKALKAGTQRGSLTVMHSTRLYSRIRRERDNQEMSRAAEEGTGDAVEEIIATLPNARSTFTEVFLSTPR